MLATQLRMRISWAEKLANGRHSKVVPIPESMQRRFGAGTMLIPKPLDVDRLVRLVPKGKLITQSQIRNSLAQSSGADVTCPLVTGIAIRIVAEAAAEQERQGARRITPYWRVVKDDGKLLDKIPCGAAGQGRRLQAEGHSPELGKSPRVKIVPGVLVEI